MACHSPSSAPLPRGTLGPLSWRLIPATAPGAQWEIVLALLSAAALAVALLLPLEAFVSWLPPCRFHAWTGLPCPSCGVTRGLLALRAGHLGQAMAWNPLLVGLALVGLGYGLLCWVIWWARWPRLRLSLARRWAGWLIAGVVLSNWLWLWIRGDV
ncbi:MAG TPA: DUF2752 domain-containing protein [Sedimenticola sp.]|nr:DUF2752 domain-containing protein [Sedimenticola sp.]